MQMQGDKSRVGRSRAAALAPVFRRLCCSDALPQLGNGDHGHFDRLDESCVARILSFTSPRDACRLSAVCRKFQAAAESDTSWERFLPPDWWQLIPRSVYALHFVSKRDLFFRLSKPILVDDSRRVDCLSLLLLPLLLLLGLLFDRWLDSLHFFHVSFKRIF